MTLKLHNFFGSSTSTRQRAALKWPATVPNLVVALGFLAAFATIMVVVISAIVLAIIRLFGMGSLLRK